VAGSAFLIGVIITIIIVGIAVASCKKRKSEWLKANLCGTCALQEANS